jgi:hypothetical protein
MLTDVALKALKPREKIYKVADRDGMYVRVTPRGAISFLLDYRLNGRRETVHLGKYGHDGISLARAREKCLDARRAIREGRSPAIEKQRDKRRIKEAKSFGQFGEKWLTAAPMADSTRAMRRTIYLRERASTGLAQPSPNGDHARRSKGPLRQNRRSLRAGDSHPREGYRQTDLRVRDPAW